MPSIRGGIPVSKLWSGRFTKETDKLVDEFTSSIAFDQELVKEDIQGSIAHVQMLAECNIISDKDSQQIKAGLERILAKTVAGEIEFDVAQEDIHMNIEKLLYDTIGPVAGKLHTARSRNDQVATDMHLYLKQKVQLIIRLITHVQYQIIHQAETHVNTLIPGYTHLQRAQPLSFAHHIMTYFWMFDRDKQRFIESMKRIDILPLGAGALAGTTFPINRQRTAELLEMKAIYHNSIDAVSDRDFIVEFLSNASLLMMHISRLSEELIFWSAQEFRFIELDDAFCTGSSIMPQKKNPDVPELLRGKTGRVYGHLISLLTTLKGLPLAYNKDMQEDKEGMFDTTATLTAALKILAPLLETMTIHDQNMSHAVDNDYANATDIADYLSTKGVPFREAHELIGHVVLYAIQSDKLLLELSLAEYKQFSELFDRDIYQVLQPLSVIEKRNSYGGTAPKQVQKQIDLAKEMLKKSNLHD